MLDIVGDNWLSLYCVKRPEIWLKQPFIQGGLSANILYFIFSITARCLWPGRSISPRSCEAVLAHSMTCTFTLAFANMPWRGKLCWWTFMFSHWTLNALVCASKNPFENVEGLIPWLTSNWNFGKFCNFTKVSILEVVALWVIAWLFQHIRGVGNSLLQCTVSI